MAVLRNLVVKIGADTSGLQKGLGDAQTKLGSSVGAMQKQGGKMAGIFTQAGVSLANMSSAGTSALTSLGAAAGPVGIGVAAAIGLATAAFSALQAAARETMPLYQEAAENEARLITIMRQRMGATDDMVAAAVELANAEQQTGAVEADAVVAGQQQLATFLHSTDALAKLTPALADLMAQQKGVNATSQDGVTIGNMFGKVMAGQTSALKKVGISFSEAQEAALKEGTEMERAAMLAKIITANVGNMNQSMANTPIGALAQLNNAWGDLKEQVGEAFTNLLAGAAPALIYLINLLAKVMEWVVKITAVLGYGWRKMTESILGSNKKMAASQDKNAESAKGVAAQQKKVGKAIGGARKEAQKWLATFDQLNKIQKVNSGGGGGGGVDELNVDDEIDIGLSLGDVEDEVERILAEARQAIIDAWNRLKEKFPVLAEIEATANLVGYGIKTTLAEIGTFAQNAWDELVKGGTEIRDELRTLWTVVSSKISTAWNDIWWQVRQSWAEIKESGAQIAGELKSLWSVVSSEIHTAWSKIWDQVKDAWAKVKSGDMTIGDALRSVWSVASASISTAWTNIKSKVVESWNKIVPKVVEIGDSLRSIWSVASSKISTLWKDIKWQVGQSWAKISRTGVETGGKIRSLWSAASAKITTLWKDIVWMVVQRWADLRDGNKDPEVAGNMSAGFSVRAKISETWEKIKKKVLDSWKDLKKTAIDVKTSVGLKWDLVVAGFTGAWDDVVTEAKKAINRVIGEFNKLIRTINSFGVDIPWWLGGGRFSLHLPTIPTIPLATGGYVQGRTFAELGEQGYAEAVVPLERNLGWAKIMAREIVGELGLAGGPQGGNFNLYLDGRPIAARVERIQSVNNIRSNGRR